MSGIAGIAEDRMNQIANRGTILYMRKEIFENNKQTCQERAAARSTKDISISKTDALEERVAAVKETVEAFEKLKTYTRNLIESAFPYCNIDVVV